MAYMPETDNVTKEKLEEVAISLGHPPAVVRTFNMRVYEVPQDVYDAMPEPRRRPEMPEREPRPEPKREEQPEHKRRGRPPRHQQQTVIDAPQEDTNGG